jgi:hypothetical protein
MPIDLTTALAQLKAAASAFQAQANAAVLAAQAAMGQAGAQLQAIIAAIEEPETPPVIPPAPAKPDDVSGLAVTPLDGALLLTWTNPAWVTAASNTGLFIVSSLNPIDFTPTDKTPYATGQGIPNVGLVATVTSATRFTETGLTNGKTYHYRLYTYDAQGRYSAGVAISGTPVAGATLPPEPPPVVTPPPSTDPNPPPAPPPATPPTDPRITIPVPAFLPVPFLPPAPIPADAPPPTLSDGWKSHWGTLIEAGEPFVMAEIDAALGKFGVRYDDAGDYACALYGITGEQKYLDACLARLDDPSLNHTWLVDVDNANWWREYGVRTAAMYIVLRDRGVFEGRPDLRQRFWDVQNKRCALAFSFYPLLTSDSDQTVGALFVKLWALISVPDGNEGARQYLDHPMNDLVHMVVVDYLRRAKGGQWIEGTDYNKETLRVLFRILDLYRYVTGMDEMPEATAWARQCARSEMALVRDPASDDYACYQWGAIEHVRDPIWFRSLSQLGLIQNFSRDPYLQSFLRAAFRAHTDIYGGTGTEKKFTNRPWTSDLLWCCWNPADPGIDYRTAPEFDASKGFAISDSPGVGLTVFRDGPDTFGGVMSRNMLNVDHYLDAGTIHQIHYKGTWIDTHALGYESMPPDSFNSFQWYGNGAGLFSGAIEVCNRLAFAASDDAIYSFHALGGNAVGDGFSGPPPVFLQEISGSLVVLPGAKGNACATLVIHDRTNIDRPFDPSLTYDQVRTLMNIHEDEYQGIKDSPRKKRVFRSMTEPVVSADRVTWTIDDKTARVMWFSASPVVVTVRKDTDADGIWVQEMGYRIDITFGVDRKWDTITYVQQVWAKGEPVPAEPTWLRSAAGEAEGVLVKRVGYPDTALLFNARPGPDLPNPAWGVEYNYRLAYDGKQADRINRNRYHPSGFTVSLPGPCDVLIFDLDPARTDASAEGVKKFAGISGALALTVAA